ncbi:MAG: hypothetical protein V2A34_02440 [Lentisphaerota bacterium]
MKTVLLSVLVLLLASCIPLFDNPLPAVPENMTDPALSGTWVGTGGSSNSQVSFLPRQSGWMDVVYLTSLNGASQDNGLDCQLYEGYGSVVNSHRILCLRMRKKDFEDHHEKPETYSYIYARYRIEDGHELAIQLFSESAIKEAIENKSLAGVVNGGSGSNDVCVTASSDEMEKFIGGQDLESLLSNEPLMFRR